MIIFPNCKINLGLRILRKRNDGYHDLETVFYPLPLSDVLEIVQSPEKEVSFTGSGINIENGSNNLCRKAYDLLKKDFPDLPAVKIHLHKAIPVGGGLGGGSSDAAFTLLLLNNKFNLGLTNEQLLHYALQLGSDCPFFIINKPCFAEKRGELLEQTTLNLSSYDFLLINPGIHISTADAFAGIVPSAPSKSVKEIIQQPIETWKEELQNDFEISVFIKHPEIKTIKEELYKKEAVYASLSGSGSTVYGIFRKDTAFQFSFPQNYFTKRLSGKL